MYQWLQRIFTGKPAPTLAPSMPAAPPPPAPAPVADAAPRFTLPPELPFDQRDSVDTAYLQLLFDSDGAAGLDTSAAEEAVLDTIAAILQSQQSGAALVRRLPGLIPQLLQSLRSNSASAAQLSRLISSDVVLVAAVIRVANALYKGTGTQITSVEHAVILIGQEGLRQLITSVAFRPIIDINSGHYTRTLAPRIWDQSERCALANRALAEASGSDPFEAFLAGLVQNVGLIVSLRVMDQITRDQIARDQIAKDQASLGSEMFCARLIQQARALTCSIGHEWHFPEAVVGAIGAQGGMRKGASPSPPGRLLTLADHLSKLRLLADAARLPAAETALLERLPAIAVSCYRSLDAVAELPA